MPEVSIIVPVYNAEKYLDKSLSSIVDQTFTDFELIVVNDGSRDGSLSICRRYAEKDKRVRIIDKENEGTVKTRLRGLNEAEGKYVAFVDADDWIARGAIEALYKSAKATDADICVGRFVKVISSLGLFKIGRNSNFNYYLQHSDLFIGADTDFLTRSFLFAGCFPCVLHAKLFRRSIFEKSFDYLGDIKFVGDDQYWNMGLFMNANRISLIDEEIYYYRGLFGGTTKYMPYYFHDILCGWDNKLKAADKLYPEPQKNYGGIAQAQIDLLDSCVTNLFCSDMTDEEIKSKIQEYISNDKVKEILNWQIDGFLVDFTNALRNNDADYIFNRAQGIAANRAKRQKILNLLNI